MRIDVHAHYWTDEYLDLLAGFGKPDTATQRGLGAGGGAELAARFALMDRAGVDMQILSASPQLPHFDEEAHAVRAARLVNDEYAAVTAAHPDRFRAFAALPLPHVDASLAELARAMDELGMLGATITTSILGRSPADAAWAPIFAELDRRGAALYVHPAGCGAGSPLISPYHLTWMIGAPIEDTVAILHFITHGIPSRYSAHEDHRLASRRRAADGAAAARRSLPLGGAGHAGAAEPRRAPHVVRHRRPHPRARLALRLRVARRRPASAGHRLSV